MQVFHFGLAHHFLVLSLYPNCKIELKRKYILCYYCEALPPRPRWIIEDLKILELEKNRWLVTDWKQGVIIPCGAVQIRDEFDIRHYLAVHEVNLTENKVHYLDEEIKDSSK